MSSAHQVFAFAFDGTTHAPDQVARIRAWVHEQGTVRSALTLRGDLLTLHTTDTPVAFVEAKISLEHSTRNVVCELYLYTGIYLSINAEAVIQHSYPSAAYYRDFPFGEERTRQSDFSSTSYLRVVSDVGGFTLVHPGTQKIQLDDHRDGGQIRNLISRGRVLGEYLWKYELHFGQHQPHDSARLARVARIKPNMMKGVWHTAEFCRIEDPRILLLSLFEDEGRLTVRLVNYSSDHVSTDIVFGRAYAGASITDFHGGGASPVAVATRLEGTVVTLELGPWEISNLTMIP